MAWSRVNSWLVAAAAAAILFLCAAAAAIEGSNGVKVQQQSK
jgi:hypothetical protein